MSTVQSYKSWAEKEAYYADNRIINKPDDLDVIIHKLTEYEQQTKIRYVFRGVSEAKYKLYTSAQRVWHTRNLEKNGISFLSFINGILQAAKKFNHGLLCDYFQRLGVTINDWLILSFLQHYGAPSPLLDFSKKVEAALFFGINTPSIPIENDLNHYFSIYYYKTVDITHYISKSIYKLIKQDDEIKIMDFETTAQYETLQSQIWKKYAFLNLMEHHTTLIIPTYPNNRIIKNKENKTISEYVIANLNSTAQNGEFVCNGTSDKPLEEIFKSGTKPYIHCINIHKSLREYIICKYLEGDIIRAQHKYYPSEKDIAEQSYIEYMKTGCK